MPSTFAVLEGEHDLVTGIDALATRRSAHPGVESDSDHGELALMHVE
jgi:hypothetical protein